MLEMNFEVVQHFLSALVGLLERLSGLYNDACQLSSRVSRQSLEFGESGVSTALEVRSRVRRHPVKSLALITLCLSLLFRLRGRGLPRRRKQELTTAFACAALDGAWTGGVPRR